MPIHGFTLRRFLLSNIVVLILALLMSMVLPQQIAHAGAFTVTSTADTAAPGTLRTAITAANAAGGTNTISFSALFSTPQIITLTGNLPHISNNLTISGPGAGFLTIDGSDTYQPFLINAGTTVNLSGMTIANGTAANGGAIANAGTLIVSGSVFTSNGSTDNGGGIYNAGTLSVTNSTFSADTASDSGGGIFNDSAAIVTLTNNIFSGNSANIFGGGIYNVAGTLTITNSTFSGNWATTWGGSIYNDFTGTLAITDSTLSGNWVINSSGGAIFNVGTLAVTNNTFSANKAFSWGGGIFDFAGTLIITNSTFSANRADGGGGGIYLTTGTVAVNNSIIANSVGGDCVNSATLTVQNSLIMDGSCGVTNSVNGNLVANPLLGPLQNNGGAIQTMALGAGSPAINAGDNTLAVDPSNSNAPLTTDQRGMPRIVGGVIDIGAFEVQSGLHLAFVQQPSSTAVSATVTPAVTVAVEDASNAVISTDQTTQITLSIGANPGGGLLGGTQTVTVVNGVATFSNLSIDKVGVGYTLTAASNPPFAGTTSNPFDITSGATVAPASTAIPAVFFECQNLAAQTGGAMTSDGGIGAVHSGDETGNVYCHVIAKDGNYVTSSAEIGVGGVINLGVEQAVDVFGELPGGFSVVPFDRPVQICLRGSGEVLFLDAATAERTVERLGAVQQGSYLCVSLTGSGTLVLVSGASGLAVLPPAPTEAPPQPVSTSLTECRVTTTNAPLNLRAEPSTSGAVLAQLPYNITLTATQYMPGWYNVIYLDGQGWVSATYLSFAGECGQ